MKDSITNDPVYSIDAWADELRGSHLTSPAAAPPQSLPQDDSHRSRPNRSSNQATSRKFSEPIMQQDSSEVSMNSILLDHDYGKKEMEGGDESSSCSSKSSGNL